MMPERVLCVIIHFRDVVLTQNCIDSVLTDPLTDIVIVDNDPEQDYEVESRHKGRVQMIRTGGNIGFAAANNLGARAGRNETHWAILLLNNDTVVIGDGIRKMAELLKDPSVGAVGPCMPYMDQPEIVWACGGYVDKSRVTIGPYLSVNDGKPFQVGYLPGAAILCKADLWDKAKGLPEKYFLAYEEAELAVNINRMGYKIMVEPAAVILHKVGMSSEVRPKYKYNSVRNRIKFGRFLFGGLQGAIWAVVLTFAQVVKWGGFSIWIRAVIDEMKNMPLDHKTLSEIEIQFKK